MTAGVVPLTVKDGSGNPRVVYMWSDTGDLTGILTPLHTIEPGQFAVLATDAKLEAIRALLAASLSLPTGASTAANQTSANTLLTAIETTLGSAATAANQASAITALGSILTALQAQRAETLWTDDTEAYFVRLDQGGTITWTTITGSGSSAPGTGARPVAGQSAIIDRVAYQAIATATGYTSGDFIDHVVVTDPNTGTVIGHFWLNITAETKLAGGPSSANLTLISSTDSKLEAIRALLAGTLAVTDSSVVTLLTAMSAKMPAQIDNAVPVVRKGSVGTDLSIYASGITWPNLGQQFSNAGPFALWTYLGKFDADPNSAEIEIVNLAGQVVLLLLDNNVATAGNPPVTPTPIVLPFGIAGGAATSKILDRFKGRGQFYALNALSGNAYIAINKR